MVYLVQIPYEARRILHPKGLKLSSAFELIDRFLLQFPSVRFTQRYVVPWRALSARCTAHGEAELEAAVRRGCAPRGGG